MSLRLHIILLAAVCTLPAIALLASDQLQLRDAREAEVRREIFGLAQAGAGEVKGTIEGARQFLTALEQAPAIRERNAPYCSALLTRMQKANPGFASIVADDPSGRSYCSSDAGRAVYDSDDYAFRTALQERRFVVGGYTASPFGRTAVLPVAEPVITPDGTLLGVLRLSIDLEWLAHNLEAKLPPGAGLTIADRNRTVLLRIPAGEPSRGTTLPAPFLANVRPDGPATADAIGFDGTPAIIAYAQAGDSSYGLDIVATRSKQAAFAALDHTTRDGIAVIVVGMVLALLAAIVLAWRFIQVPVSELLSTAERLRQGEFSRHTALTSQRSELGRLGRALNALAYALEERKRDRDLAEAQLLELTANLEQRVAERTRELATTNAKLAAEAEERQRAQATLAQAQKLDAIGQITGGVAHDFNNLLAAILGSLEIALKRTQDTRVTRLLTVALQAAERGAKLTAHMLAFSRKQDLVLQPVDVNATISGMSDLLRRTLGPMVRMSDDLAGELWPAVADPVQLEVALLNLSVNARDAMPDGGTLTFRARNVTTAEAVSGQAALPPGDYVMITVSDTGQGMPPEVQSKAFEPFFTTKGPGKGTGLGLSMVYGFARQAGGTVTIDSRPGGGTAISLYLPRAPTQPVGSAVQPETSMATHRLRILMVDDDADVRATIAEMLHDLGHEVSDAASGPAALALLRARPDFHLLLADFAMPDMTGLQLAAQVRALHPALPILLMTGYAELSVRQSWAEHGYQSVTKPFDSGRLTAAMREVLGLSHAAPPG